MLLMFGVCLSFRVLVAEDIVSPLGGVSPVGVSPVDVSGLLEPELDAWLDRLDISALDSCSEFDSFRHSFG